MAKLYPRDSDTKVFRDFPPQVRPVDLLTMLKSATEKTIKGPVGFLYHIYVDVFD